MYVTSKILKWDFKDPAAITKTAGKIALAVALGFAMTDTAFAQAVNGSDPFSTASTAANTFEKSLATFSLAVGGIGMVACLLLGFFGKLNWRWVATGIGVSFAIAGVPPMISYLSSLNTMTSSSTTTGN